MIVVRLYLQHNSLAVDVSMHVGKKHKHLNTKASRAHDSNIKTTQLVTTDVETFPRFV